MSRQLLIPAVDDFLFGIPKYEGIKAKKDVPIISLTQLCA